MIYNDARKERKNNDKSKNWKIKDFWFKTQKVG